MTRRPALASARSPPGFAAISDPDPDLAIVALLGLAPPGIMGLATSLIALAIVALIALIRNATNFPTCNP